ncbi:MAG: asparagine synthase-related protein, partial [Candidatus Eremiobacterota bacterium]
PGSPDLEMAARVARHLGTEHHEVLLDQHQIFADLDRILEHLESYDPDLVLSAIPCFYVSQLASRYVKVVLTGEGADELFAGYRYHRDYVGRPDRLRRELQRLIANLHHMNLQRVDRMSMAHGLEARVPFLDAAFIHLAEKIPPEQKEPREVDKLPLRLAARGLLPEEIVWRDKSQFDEGSGVRGLLSSLLDPQRLRRRFFRTYPEEVDRLVARWGHGRVSPN